MDDSWEGQPEKMHKGKGVKYQPKKHIQAGIRGHINITSTFSSFFLVGFFPLKTMNPAIVCEGKAIAP